jgi:hypothetical protein
MYKNSRGTLFMMQGKTTGRHEAYTVLPSKVGCFAEQLIKKFLFLTQIVIQPLDFATIFSCTLASYFCFEVVSSLPQRE